MDLGDADRGREQDSPGASVLPRTLAWTLTTSEVLVPTACQHLTLGHCDQRREPSPPGDADPEATVSQAIPFPQQAPEPSMLLGASPVQRPTGRFRATTFK